MLLTITHAYYSLTPTHSLTYPRLQALDARLALLHHRLTLTPTLSLPLPLPLTRSPAPATPCACPLTNSPRSSACSPHCNPAASHCNPAPPRPRVRRRAASMGVIRRGRSASACCGRAAWHGSASPSARRNSSSPGRSATSPPPPPPLPDSHLTLTLPLLLPLPTPNLQVYEELQLVRHVT